MLGFSKPAHHNIGSVMNCFPRQFFSHKLNVFGFYKSAHLIGRRYEWFSTTVFSDKIIIFGVSSKSAHRIGSLINVFHDGFQT